MTTPKGDQGKGQIAARIDRLAVQDVCDRGLSTAKLCRQFHLRDASGLDHIGNVVLPVHPSSITENRLLVNIFSLLLFRRI